MALGSFSLERAAGETAQVFATRCLAVLTAQAVEDTDTLTWSYDSPTWAIDVLVQPALGNALDVAYGTDRLAGETALVFAARVNAELAAVAPNPFADGGTIFMVWGTPLLMVFGANLVAAGNAVIINVVDNIASLGADQRPAIPAVFPNSYIGMDVAKAGCTVFIGS